MVLPFVPVIPIKLIFFENNYLITQLREKRTDINNKEIYKFIKESKKILKDDDTILLKASRGMDLETLLEILYDEKTYF